jgi:hypothetical protein
MNDVYVGTCNGDFPQHYLFKLLEDANAAAQLKNGLEYYANQDNWKSVGGVMVLQTMDHQWNTAAAVLKALKAGEK